MDFPLLLRRRSRVTKTTTTAPAAPSRTVGLKPNAGNCPGAVVGTLVVGGVVEAATSFPCSATIEIASLEAVRIS